MTRTLRAGIVMALVSVAMAAPVAAVRGPAERVIVLGFDGMDYDLLQRLMDEGSMPNCARLATEGSYAPLGTSVPPQSPVAWSNFITGMDAGGHGIFDFIHRDPKTMVPYLSTSRTTSGGEARKLFGKWQLPAGDTIELLRHGTAFWEVLESAGVECTVLRMPANFPPSGTATRELSGMGTPDIIGTYGTFAFFTSDDTPFVGQRITGGKVYPVSTASGVVHGKLHGPDNPFLVERTKVAAPFTAAIDPERDAILLTVGDEERVMEAGEWSGWIPIEFHLDFGNRILDFALGETLHGIARFYLKQVRPVFQLYVSPVNMDPEHPAMPISTPDAYAGELARATGDFYTQGMPEDTKALTQGILTPEEFLAQAKITGDEIIDQYDYVLENFDGGFLFYYFGNQDQVGHMMWRTMDPDHPSYDAARDEPLADAIPSICRDLDRVVGTTLDHMDPNTTLIVMSDHGFSSWKRAFHLNTWLREHGFLKLIDPYRTDDPGLFANVDWTQTRAYGLGINGLYVNQRGRERWGIVEESEKGALLEEIRIALLDTVDPKNGEYAVTKVYLPEVAYKDRGHLEIGPDMLVGYAKGVRGSNESALGEVPPEVFADNMEAWSGDHCMDDESVPGILLTNRTLRRSATNLGNLAASILAEFGVEDTMKERLESVGYASGKD
ncbi:MAG: alkaline phosphatase family protein [Gemmatimonadota bacterium]|nr:alkaline phosphatase family protein [Gemmatimonadota bacterium]